MGLPIKSGGPLLDRALASVLEQTHSNLQVLIGDNATAPDVAARFTELARRDPRVSVLRSEEPLSAVRNFARVFEAARGDYFCWAAADDLRAPNYVATLLRALERRPGASLAFSDLALIDGSGDLQRARPRPHDFATEGLSLEERLRKQAFCPPYHIYGLIRSAALRGYPWYEPDMAPDWPLMAWLAVRGTFVYAAGATFYYHDVEKTEEQKAEANALRELRRFQGARMAWVCTTAALEAGRQAGPGRYPRRWPLLLRYYLWHGRGWRHLLLWRSPALLRRVWWWCRGTSRP